MMPTAWYTAGIAPLLAIVNPVAGAEPAIGTLMMRLMLQLAAVVIAARIGGYLFRRFLKLPRVLGELTAGMLIGPHALGNLAIPGVGALFPLQAGHLPITVELYGFATLASIVLLFLSGLQTDLATFLRFSVVGTLVGVGGILASFFLGDLCALWFGLSTSFTDPAALFMGTIATATSVGITARILSERRKMGAPEGVTILAGAVLDDVLGIVVLAVVVGIVRHEQGEESLKWLHIVLIGVKAIGFWLVCMLLGLLFARRFSHLLKLLGAPEIIASLALGSALLLAGISEMAGLTMIIGAYIMGISLSRTDIVYELQDQLQGMYNFLVPAFFCVMGMLVDFRTMHGVVLFGLTYSLLAFLAKVIGCGIPAWLTKFSGRGALRVGVGMVPRGEVALIIAGIGLSTGAIGSNVFGVAVMMAMFSTMLAPPLLIQLFKGGSGVRGKIRARGEEIVTVELKFPSADIAEFLRGRITRAFREEEFFVHGLQTDTPTYQIRKEDMSFTLIQDAQRIIINAPQRYQHIARMIVLEELLSLQDLFDSAQKMKSPNSMGAELINGMFS